jgi:hypothetical protein
MEVVTQQWHIKSSRTTEVEQNSKTGGRRPEVLKQQN